MTPSVRHGEAVADAMVLINGLPGSGKSTIAAQLGTTLQAPVLSKDQVKEALADACGLGFVEGSTLGRIAMEVVWALAAAASGTVIGHRGVVLVQTT